MNAEIFGWKLSSGQLKIVGAVLDPKVNRLSICAMTRYGKTRSVAIACLLYILSNPGTKILFIGPTQKQTNIIRNYTSEHIAAVAELADLVDYPGRSDPAKLKQEVSKQRVTFRNSCEIVSLTAHGSGEEPGAQLMGFGGDIIVLDEACLISDEVYRKRISRMLGDNPNSKLIELVNPWHRHNFAYRHWISPDFKKIHVDWRQALQEDRITSLFLEEQRRELSRYEFEVLYESLFAEDAEDALIWYSWLQRAFTHKQQLSASELHTVWGLDVAEKGTDQTVLMRSETDGYRYRITKIYVLKERETMDTANKVAETVSKSDILNVDSIGVGAGVYSRLKELGYRAASVRVSQAPTRDSDRYLNQKAQRYWLLRSLFEENMIEIPNNHNLVSELSKMRYEFTSTGKIRIIDPEQKSPDFADAIMLCLLLHDKKKPKIF